MGQAGAESTLRNRQKEKETFYDHIQYIKLTNWMSHNHWLKWLIF